MLTEPDFRRYLAASVVSSAGSALTGVVLPLIVLRKTGSAFLTSLVVVVEVTPYLMFGLLAGALADGARRRRMMYLCEAVSGGASFVFVAVVAAGGNVAVTALVVAGAVQVSSVFFGAAAFAAVPTLVGRERVVEAQSLLSSATLTVGLLAPATGAALFGAIGAVPLFAADGVSFFVSALLLARITTEFHSAATTSRNGGDRRRTVRRLRSEIADGVRYLWAERLVRALTLIGVLNAAAGGMIDAVLVVFAGRSFGVAPDDAAISTFFLAGSIGSLVGMAVLPVLRRRLPALKVTELLLVGSAAGAAALAAAPGLAVAVVACGLWRMTYGMTITNGITLRMQVLPDRYQSRVGSTARLLALSGSPVGALAAGVLAERVGIRVVMAAVVVPVIVGLALAVAFLQSLGDLTSGPGSPASGKEPPCSSLSSTTPGTPDEAAGSTSCSGSSGDPATTTAGSSTTA